MCTLGFKGQRDWREYTKSNRRPEGIPANPARTYRKEWKGWGDWLGTGNISDTLRDNISLLKRQESLRILLG